MHLPHAQALDLGTHVGERHVRWSWTGRGYPTDVRLSNGCTQLQRLSGGRGENQSKLGARRRAAPVLLGI